MAKTISRRLKILHDDSGEKIFTITDICTLYTISPPTLYLWERKKIFPKREKFKGNRVGWRQSVIEAFLKEKMKDV